MLMLAWIMILFIILKKSNSQHISIPLKYNYYLNFVWTEISIGTPPRLFNFIIDSTVIFSEIMLNNNYNQTISSTLKISTGEVSQGNYHKGNLSSDILRFDSIAVPNFLFIFIDDSSLDFVDRSNQGIISLCRSTTSLLSRLYYERLIHKRIFQLHQKSITFGVINTNINNAKSSRCELVPYNNTWACQVKGISFENNPNEIHPVNTKVVFNLNKRNLIFPFIYWELFKEKYFKTFIENNNCQVYSGFIGWQIECPDIIASKLGSMTIYIGNSVELELKFDDLFEEDILDMDQQMFQILFQKHAINIEFGLNLFEKFSIGLNDNEDYAEFFVPIKSNPNQSPYKRTSYRLALILFSTCMIVLLCGLVMLFIVRCKF